jgi:methylenetetrahydrofolate dehydrogenase (NADP+)/methenyltetrahydrofolate cyclohydrolase
LIAEWVGFAKLNLSFSFVIFTRYMQILDGKTLATKILMEVKQKVSELPSPPGLAVILVGHDEASTAYVAQKKQAAEMVGMHFEEIHYPETATTEELLLEIAKLNHQTNINGIIVQLPLPKQIDKNAILPAIHPEKDVDGFHPLNHGRSFVECPTAIPPATPAGIMQLLRAYEIDLHGKEAVVVGRSTLVGKPLAMLLIDAGATVTVCHRSTRDLASHTRRADIVVAAAGVPHLLTGEMVKDGAIVVDVGGTKVKGKLLGDVDFDSVKAKAAYLTPVPGGVGPMTVAALIQNTLRCANHHLYRRASDLRSA